MWLEIHQFRNLSEKTVEFKQGLNLIHGSNGKGKSNTLAALEWVLYGMGKALPRKKKKACVILKIKDLIIERRKGPDYFCVTRTYVKDNNGVEALRNKQYIDKDAEEIVKACFGCYETWKAVCYIPQESRCRLFAGTKEQQIQTLNQIIFSDANPAEIQKKIESKRKEEEQELKEMKAKMEGLTFGVVEKDVDSDQNSDLSLGSLEIQAMLLFFTNQKKELEAYEAKRKQNVFERGMLEEERMKLLKGLEKMENDMRQIKKTELLEAERLILETELLSVRKNIQEILENKPIFNKIKELKSITNKYNASERQNIMQTVSEWMSFNTTKANVNATKANLNQTITNVTTALQEANFRYITYTTKCDAMEVKYNKSAIDARIHRNKETIEKYNRQKKILREKREIEGLKQKVNTLSNYKENKELELENKNKEILEFNQNRDVIQCPSCKENLTYKCGKLCVKEVIGVKGNKGDKCEDFLITLDNSEKERFYQKLLEEKNVLTQYQKYHLIYNVLLKDYEEKLRAFSERMGTKEENFTIDVDANEGLVNEEEIEKEIMKWMKQNTELESIVIMEKPPAYTPYIECKREMEREEEMSQLQAKVINKQDLEQVDFEALENKAKVISTTIQNLQLAIQANVFLNKRKKECLASVEEKNERLEQIPVTDSKEEELNNSAVTIQNIQTMLAKAYENEKMLEKKKKIQLLDRDTDLKLHRVNDIVTLKDVCRKVQSERIDESLYTINKVANEILKEIFNEPLHIEINATKETKQGKVKNELALNIEHNGDVLTTLDELNVGHSSRISLAISLALFQINQCPFLLMDEIFSAVDPEAVDNSLITMKNNLPKGRICIVTGLHYNGMYDNVIEY